MLGNTFNKIKLFHQTAKAPLCLMISLSAAFGYLLTNPDLSPNFLLTFFGVFFLACGAAATNSVQEKESDAAYERTKHRPVASGQVSLQTASLFAIINCVLGLLLLYLCGNTLLPFFLGAAALIIYNLIYTPLKRVSEFALIPGGISGALPPYIGWLSGGGDPSNPLILAVIALFFLWQPPHFCLILLEYAEDYRKKKPFKNLVTRFSLARVKWIIATWLLGFLSVILFLTMLPSFLSQGIRFTLALGAPVFIGGFLLYLFLCKAPRYKMLFVSLNGFLVSVMTLLTFSSI